MKALFVRSLRSVCLTALVTCLYLPIQKAQAGERSGDSLKGPLRAYVDRESHGLIDTSTKYVAAFTHLNDTTNIYAIVYLMGEDWCGSGGCQTLVFKRNGTNWEIVSRTLITRPPIIILDKKCHGWHSISVKVSGGGILHPYSAELNFNGKSYPINPTMPPAVRVNEPKGDIVISSLQGAKNLYSH